MSTSFIYFEKSKTSNSHRLNLSENIDLKRSDTYVALSNLSIYCAWKSIKKSHKNNRFKTSAPKCNSNFELPDRSNSVSNIQGYFEHIIKNHETITDNPTISIYLSKIENKITIKTKTGYYLELLTLETMKLLGRTKSKLIKEQNGENIPHLEIIQVVLVHWNIVKNDYQQDPKVLDTFIPNNFFVQLLDILTKDFIFLKTFNSNFLFIEVWFTNQNSKSLKIKDKIHTTLVIN